MPKQKSRTEPRNRIQIIIAAIPVEKEFQFNNFHTKYTNAPNKLNNDIIKPVIAIILNGILVYLTIKEMWKNSLTDFVTWLIFLGCFSASFFFKVSPVLSIIGSVIVGVSYKCFQKGREK